MVRPVARHGILRKLIADNNRGFVAPARKTNIANALRLEIEQIGARKADGVVTILDVGCGDMGISEILTQQLPGIEITCVDTYAPPPSDAASPKWKKYRQFDGRTLPFGNAEFDISICIDVLHHAGMEGAQTLLREMLRTSRFQIVKDHFETGLVSRTLLQLADFYGNWGYGVNVPREYFREQTWRSAITKSGLEELRRINSVRIHSQLLSAVFPSKLHFISVMTRSGSGGETTAEPST